MPPTDLARGPAPARGQTLVAGLLAAGLAAMAAWYVASGGLSSGLVHHDAPPPASAMFTVDLNTADATELAQLPGLGPATAARIIDHRRTHGPFTSIDGLLDVPGIGAITLEGVQPHLRPLTPAAEAR
ncbi:MAG: ComEA family DNA-binding protein [Planctomycetota bacterium]